MGVTAALLFATAPPTSRPPARNLQFTGDDGFELGFQGFAGRVPDTKKPKLTAYFTRESYRPEQTAQLVVTDTAPAVTIRFYRAGGEDQATIPNDVMLGTPVSKPVRSAASRAAAPFGCASATGRAASTSQS